MATLVSLLQDAGFTEYEARAYVALLNKSPQTGYELAKTSRIPRANVYEVLHKLEARGAATRVVSPETIRYTAVEPQTVLHRMKHSFTTMMHDMEQQVAALAVNREAPFVESFEGYENLIAFAHSLVADAAHGLLLAVHPQEASSLAQPIETAYNRGVAMNTLCLHGCREMCPACRGAFRRNRFERVSQGRWFVAVADESLLVAGEIHGESVNGFRTRLPLLAKIAAMYIEQSMLFSGLVEDGQLSAEIIRNHLESQF